MNIYFVSGLPRSGSTLLLNLLGQNPNIAVTPTSGLIELFVGVKNNWKKHIEFKSEGLENAKPKVLGALKGMLYGYFDKSLQENKASVFDKSRGWLQYIEDLEECLGERVKVLVPIRDVRDICASFERIYQNRGIEYDYAVGGAFFECQTIVGRCENLLHPKGIVGIAINRIRDAMARKIRDRLILIPARTLTTKPKETLEDIHSVLKLPLFDYKFDDIKQITYENDLWHGMDLHAIKKDVSPIPYGTWKEILPEKYANSLYDRYRDVCDWSGSVEGD